MKKNSLSSDSAFKWIEPSSEFLQEQTEAIYTKIGRQLYRLDSPFAAVSLVFCTGFPCILAQTHIYIVQLQLHSCYAIAYETCMFP